MSVRAKGTSQKKIMQEFAKVDFDEKIRIFRAVAAYILEIIDKKKGRVIRSLTSIIRPSALHPKPKTVSKKTMNMPVLTTYGSNKKRGL